VRGALPTVLAALVLGAATAAGCGGSGEGDASGTAAPRSADGGAGHVHGLGVDPADGRLLIATHQGLFAAGPGRERPAPVGATRHDLMGFTVVGPGHLVASGHPGPGAGLPPNLGLVESRDGGRTWQSVSLSGEADFHALDAAGRTVAGYDATGGRLLVSGDGGRTWAPRTPPGPVFDLALDPQDPDRLLVSTERGLALSRDGGAGWRPLRADVAGLVAWPRGGGPVVVTGEGLVLGAGEDAADWETRGDAGGAPVALSADGRDLHVALADGTVRRSGDGGATWAVRAPVP
jgi:hypothetical protein